MLEPSQPAQPSLPIGPPPPLPAGTIQYTSATNVSTASVTACLAAAQVSSTIITVGGVSGNWLIAGGNAGAIPSSVLAKISESITGKGAQVTTSVNDKLAGALGACKTKFGPPQPPRAPKPPRAPAPPRSKSG